MIPSDSPVIIIGMHRSGTSMLSHLLEKEGLFLGKHKDRNNEATFFIKLNDWILRETGGRWDTPEGMVNFDKIHPLHIDVILAYLEDQFKSPKSIEFWGPDYLRYLINGNYPCHWGWKDPRTTLTLDFWVKLFPNMKVVHIKRNGVDVAESLRVRSMSYLSRNSHIYYKRRILYSIFGKRGIFTDSPRSLTLEGGFTLWEQYLSRTTELKKRLGSRYFELKYEDLLLSPRRHLTNLHEFCGVSSPEINNREIVEYFNVENAYKYRSNNELVDFSLKVMNRAKRFGY